MNEGLRIKLIEACAEIGIQFKVVDVDGEWHRTDVSNDQHGRDDASIKLFREGNGGIVKNWKSGESRVVFSGTNHNSFNKSNSVTKNELALPLSKTSLGNEQPYISIEAASRAKRIWDAAEQAASDHPYLSQKKICAHGIRQYKGMLIIPVLIDGEIRSIQFIAGDGKKMFLKKGRVTGGYYMIRENKECKM